MTSTKLYFAPDTIGTRISSGDILMFTRKYHHDLQYSEYLNLSNFRFVCLSDGFVKDELIEYEK